VIRDWIAGSPRRKRLLWTAVIAVAGLGMAWLVSASDLGAGARRTWLRVEHRELVLGIPTEGELRAVDSALIGPPQLRRIWNFQISMIAPEGAEVQAGQPVLGFDTTELQQRLRQSMAEADAAEKALEKAVTDLDIQRRQLALRLEEARARLRQTELKVAASADVTAAIELEKAGIDKRLAETEIRSLEASLEQHGIRNRMELATLESKLELARAQVADQQAAIEQMSVKAPRAGTLILRSDWRGQKKQVGDRVWRAEKVVEIPDLSAMEGAAEVDEQAAGRLAEGLPVTFRLDAYPDREYRARVALIRRAVQAKSFQNPSKIVKLTLEVEQTDTERMRPGMRFVGTIAAQTIAGALSVPALCVSSDEGGAFVEVRGGAGGAFGSRKVYPELGRRNDEYVEVLSGLSEGDRVLRRVVAEGAA
jgi:HlyD family secretion protein